VSPIRKKITVNNVLLQRQHINNRRYNITTDQSQASKNKHVLVVRLFLSKNLIPFDSERSPEQQSSILFAKLRFSIIFAQTEKVLKYVLVYFKQKRTASPRMVR